jgi:hypothetical protein
MTKGLLAHTIATMFCILSIMYIVQDKELSIEDRGGVVFFILFGNILTAMICATNNWYEEKIK